MGMVYPYYPNRYMIIAYGSRLTVYSLIYTHEVGTVLTVLSVLSSLGLIPKSKLKLFGKLPLPLLEKEPETE